MADALGTPGPPGGPGVVSALDHRLDQAGLIATQGAGMAVRTGVMHGPGTTTLVTGTPATGTMTYAIAAHHWVSTRGTADGVYQGSTEAAQTVATTAAPGANSRIDVIWEKQQDQYSTLSPDATSAPQWGVTQGTAAVSPVKPPIPVGALELATAVVEAGATSTNGSGVTITNTARQTVARGAAIPVRNQAERDALTTYPGHPGVRRLDTGLSEDWTGSAWRVEPVGFPIAAMHQTTAQTGLATGWNTITLQGETIDTHGGHAAAATYTIPTGHDGTYRVAGALVLPTVADSVIVGLRAIKNGVNSDRYLSFFGAVRGGPVVRPLAVPPIVLAAGDTIAMQGYCNVASWSTDASAVAGAEKGSWMSVERIR